MADYNAIVIEDDPDQVAYDRRVLQEAGFSVTVFGNAEEARRDLAVVDRPVDLVVIDRRLPASGTDEPQDDVGDALLEDVVAVLPDSPIVVFTAFADVPHVQRTTRERGEILASARSSPFDRVMHFEKGQSIEFEALVRRISDALSAIDDVEVGPSEALEKLPRAERRLLRKTALHFGGAAIKVDALAGGLAGQPVWQCIVSNDSGTRLASVVAKLRLAPTADPAGGLLAIAPAPHVAAHVTAVRGFCDNRELAISQLAGETTASLLSMLGEDEATAARQLETLAQALDGVVTETHSTKTLDQLVVPLIDWQEIESSLELASIRCPPASRIVTTAIAAQHGDLHPGNVLIVGNIPVLIDFDSQVIGSRLLDPLAMIFGSLFHLHSPLRDDDWPAADQCREFGSDAFYAGTPAPAWFRACNEWAGRRRSSEREFWALSLATAVRQLRYADVYGVPQLKDRALAIAAAAAEALDD